MNAGDTVVWVNKDLIPHTATAGRRVRFEGAGGRDVTFATVKAKGGTAYTCTFHPTMTGRIDAE